MNSKWCVRPDEDVVNLEWEGEKFWVKLKRRLTVGEDRRVQTSGWRGLQPSSSGKNENPEIKIDWQAQAFARVEAYLTDWSLEDDDRKKLVLSHDMIEALEPGVFKVIEDAVNRHVEAAGKEKKVMSGEPVPSAISA